METMEQSCNYVRPESGSANPQAFACFSCPDPLFTRVVCWHCQMWVKREGDWPMIGCRGIWPWVKTKPTDVPSPSALGVMCSTTANTTLEKPLPQVFACTKGLALHSRAIQSVIPGPAAVGSPGSLLELQIHILYPRLTKSEALGGDPGNCLNKLPRQFFCLLKSEKHWSGTTTRLAVLIPAVYPNHLGGEGG